LACESEIERFFFEQAQVAKLLPRDYNLLRVEELALVIFI